MLKGKLEHRKGGYNKNTLYTYMSLTIKSYKNTNFKDIFLPFSLLSFFYAWVCSNIDL